MLAAARRFLLRRLRGENLDLCLRDLLIDQRIDLVLDVGANTGQYGRRLRAVGYTGQILSFEPIPDLLAPTDPQWRVVQEAVGSVNDTLELRIPKATVLSSFRLPTTRASDTLRQTLAPERLLRVPVSRLDTRLPQLHPDYQQRRIHLKLDTQGYDLEAMQGLGAIAVVSVQMELPFTRVYDQVPPASEHLRIMEEGGYEFCGVYPVFRRGSVMVEGDGVFLKR